MTIEGAIAQLDELIDATDIPIYYKPALEKVRETVIMEVDSLRERANRVKPELE